MKRYFVVPFVLAAALMAPAARGQQNEQALQPIVVAAVAGYEGLITDLKYIGKALRDERYIERLNVLADTIFETKGTKIDKLEALDPKRPFGMMVVTDGVSIVPMVALPLAGDAEKLFESFKPLLGNVAKQPDGLFAFGQGERSGYAKVENGWLFTAQLPEQLAKLPDAAKLFSEVVTGYDFAVKMHIQNIPEVFRSLAVDQLRVALESAAQKRDGESDASFAFRRDLGKLQSQLIERALGETEQLSFGGIIDTEKEGGIGELLVKPLADSSLADHLGELRNLKTRFGNLIQPDDKPETGLIVNMTGPLDKQLIDEYTALVNSYRDYTLELIEKSDQVKSDEERGILKELAQSITDVLRTTIEAGQLDVAARMIDKPKRTIVFAARVAQGEELKKLVDRIAELSQGDPAFTSVKLSAAEQGGTPIHALTWKPKADSREGQMAKLFDGQLMLNVAVKEDNLLFAVGAQGIDLIKQGLDLSEAAVSPLQVQLHMQQIARLLTQAIDQDQMRMAAGLLISQIGASDGARVNADVTPEGQLRVRIETQQGAVRLAGSVFGQFGSLILEMARSQQNARKAGQDLETLEKEEGPAKEPARQQ